MYREPLTYGLQIVRFTLMQSEKPHFRGSENISELNAHGMEESKYIRSHARPSWLGKVDGLKAQVIS